MTPHPQRCWASPQEIRLLRDAANQQDADELANLILSRSASHSSALSKQKPVKNCMCDNYTNCTDCFNHDEKIRQDATEKVLEHVDEILKHEWANATNLDNPYRDDRHMVISRIRNTVTIYRKELRQEGEQGDTVVQDEDGYVEIRSKQVQP
jgi:hypothetical protein